VKIPPVWAERSELVVLEEEVERSEGALELVEFVAGRLG